MAFRTVFIKNGDKLRLKMDNLEISKGGESYYIPLEDIENILLEGNKTTISTLLLAKLAEYHIDVIVTNREFMPNGIFLGMGTYHRAAKRAQWQAQWSEQQKLTVWQGIVKQKISNQRKMLEQSHCDQDRVLKLYDLETAVQVGDSSNREGHAAKIYFNTLYGPLFNREQECIENACMDYGYAVLRAQMARSVVSQGLLPMLGIFHRNEYNAYNLVDDLMEPFRPLVDNYIHSTILSEKPNYLTYEIRLSLVDFLNQTIQVAGKNIYMNQAIRDFVLSFIHVMETDDIDKLITIDLAHVG